jgi:chromosome segregation ATPase
VYRREIEDLLQMQKIAQEEVEVVDALRRQIDESVAQLREALAQEKDLLDRGLQTRNNFRNAQQRLESAIAGFSSQSLSAGQAQRRLVEIKSRLDNLEVDRSGILMAEIAQLSAKLPAGRAALASIHADRLLVSSFSNYESTQFIRLGLQIRRGLPGAKETLPAVADMQVLPGDVIGVAVEFSFDAN